MSYRAPQIQELEKAFERMKRKTGLNNAIDPADHIGMMDPVDMREVAVAMFEMARECVRDFDEEDHRQQMEQFSFGERESSPKGNSVLIPTLLHLPDDGSAIPSVQEPSDDDGDNDDDDEDSYTTSVETPFRMSRSARSSISVDGYECINDFMILDEIGKGQFGRVVLAIRDGENDPVAIKIVPRMRLVQKKQFSPMPSPSAARAAHMQPQSLPEFKETSLLNSSGHSFQHSDPNNASQSHGKSLSATSDLVPVVGAGGSSTSGDQLPHPTPENTSSSSPLASMPPLNTGQLSTNSDLDIEALQREVAIMKKLRHRNIVALYECIDDEEEGNLYLVMQYCDKGPIFSLDERGNCPKMELSKVKMYLRQIIAGLSYLERNGVLHMDIKPDNILLNSDDVVFLADFGMSEMIEEEDDHSLDPEFSSSGIFSPKDSARRSMTPRPTAQRGTPAFMSPEMCLGNEDEITSATDVWSLGVTLYCMLIGELPFKGRSWRDTTKKIIETEPHIPHELDPTWADLLLGMLHKDPVERSSLGALRRHPLIQSRALSGQNLHEMNTSMSVSASARDMLLSPRDANIEISNADVLGAITTLHHRGTRMAPRRQLSIFPPIGDGDRPPLSPNAQSHGSRGAVKSSLNASVSQTSLLSDSWSAMSPKALSRNTTAPDLLSPSSAHHRSPRPGSGGGPKREALRKATSTPTLLVG